MAGGITVRYQGQLRCEATREKTGQTVLTDIVADHGGRGEQFTPVELVSAALGACVMSMVAIVAERHGVDVSTMEVRTDMQMASTPNRRISAIQATVQMPAAAGADPILRQKLEAAANTCPVKNSLHPDVQVKIDFVYA